MGTSGRPRHWRHAGDQPRWQSAGKHEYARRHSVLGDVDGDGKRVARLHKEIGVQIFDIQSGKAIKTLELPEQDRKSLLYPASFTPDGKALIVITENVSMWDLETGKKKGAGDPPFKNGAVNPFVQGKKSGDKDVSFAVSPDGSKIAFAVPTSQMGILKLGGDPSPTFGKSHVRVMVFETATGKQLHYAEADLVKRSDANTEQRAIALSADGQLLAVGGRLAIHVWKVGAEKTLADFEGHRGAVKALAFSPDGKRLASASEDSTVLVWDLANLIKTAP